MSSTELVPASGTASQTAARGRPPVLTFRIGGEEYGLDILRVQEIPLLRGADPRRPRPPSSRAWSTCGVIVPILDLRIRLGQPASTTVSPS